MLKIAKYTALATASLALSFGAAQAGNLGDSSSYNTPFGMSSQGQQNQTINPSLRDANGNLTMVDGEFQSSSFQSGFGMPGPEVNGQGGVGGLNNSINGTSSGTSGAAYGGSTAIGNSLNVVTVGSGNTVIVNSSQTNNGNQTSTTNMNGN